MKEEEKLDEKLNEMFKDLKDQLDATLNILVIGKVSAGKSSFLNAFLDCKIDEPFFTAGAKSGVTTKVVFKKISDNIQIADTPGLSDIIDANSQETIKMLDDGIDIGILILEGSADADQKKHYNDLKEKAGKVFVVLNKTGAISSENLKMIMSQWKDQLNMSHDEKIYPVVSRGYDPIDKIKDEITGEEYSIPTDDYGRPKTLKGIDAIRDDVLDYLEKSGKDILLAKMLKDKSKKATAIIVTACVAAAAAAFIPGSALYIGAIQATAISTLSYLYTGQMLSKSQAITTIGVFLAESVGMNLFLFVKSFLPPTGVLDVVAASIALTITGAMLLAIATIFSKGHNLDNKSEMRQVFNGFKEGLSKDFKEAKFEDLKNKIFYKNIIKKYL